MRMEWTPDADWLLKLMTKRGLVPLATNGISTRHAIEARAVRHGMRRVTALTVYRALSLDGNRNPDVVPAIRK